MKIFQTRSFEQKARKLTKQEKEGLDQEVRSIAEDPSIGEEKKGDLRGVFVYKFKLKAKQYLLAYRKLDEHLELISIGSHENDYRNLRQYLENR